MSIVCHIPILISETDSVTCELFAKVLEKGVHLMLIKIGFDTIDLLMFFRY